MQNIKEWSKAIYVKLVIGTIFTLGLTVAAPKVGLFLLAILMLVALVTMANDIRHGQEEVERLQAELSAELSPYEKRAEEAEAHRDAVLARHTNTVSAATRWESIAKMREENIAQLLRKLDGILTTVNKHDNSILFHDEIAGAVEQMTEDADLGRKARKLLTANAETLA